MMAGKGMSRERYEFIKNNLHQLELDLENGKILNRNSNHMNKGYLMLCLGSRKTIRKNVAHHQVFAVKLWGEACIGMTVNHINENKLDNSWDNLELLTHADNIRAMTTHGKHLRQPVKAIHVNTGKAIIFESQREAARQLNLLQTHIQRVIKGIKKDSGDYRFERVV
jgi:hypothetical protein